MIRTWTDGLSRLEIEHDPNGRVRFRVDDEAQLGFSVMFGPATADEICDFIQEGR